jgi:hypothetical protein
LKNKTPASGRRFLFVLPVGSFHGDVVNIRSLAVGARIPDGKFQRARLSKILIRQCHGDPAVAAEYDSARIAVDRRGAAILKALADDGQRFRAVLDSSLGSVSEIVGATTG